MCVRASLPDTTEPTKPALYVMDRGDTGHYALRISTHFALLSFINEYLKTKKDDETITKIPVVVFSNFDDSKTKEESLELGALEYLLKTDYTPQELLSRVSLYLK